MQIAEAYDPGMLLFLLLFQLHLATILQRYEKCIDKNFWRLPVFHYFFMHRNNR